MGHTAMACDRKRWQIASRRRDTQVKSASREFHRSVWLPQDGGPGCGIGLEMTGLQVRIQIESTLGDLGRSWDT